MTEQGPLAQLRNYLGELTPEARAMLLAELEKAGMSGKSIPALPLILEELRTTLRTTGKKLPRAGSPSRMFFQPVEPFLINETPEKKQVGRVSRSSLSPIWTWISRDLAPAQASAFHEGVLAAMQQGDAERARTLVRSYQDEAVRLVRTRLGEIVTDTMARQRLSAQLGSQLVFDDLCDTISILRARDQLSQLSSRLPGSIRNLADDALENTWNLLEAPIVRSPDVFPYALVIVLSRLQNPGHMIRLAVKAADSDMVSKVAGTSYAAAVDLVLVDVERLLQRLRAARGKAPMSVLVAHIKDFHDYARYMRTEMDLSGDHPWTRRLAQMRTEIAGLLKAEIEPLPGHIRRTLRPRTAAEIAPGETIDAADVAEIEKAIDLLAACRTYAGEIALNEVTLRIYSELQNYLDTGTQSLLESLRASGPGDRRFRTSQVDAAVRFCAKIFGASYAQLLTKAAEVAVQTERKQGRG